MCVCMSTFSNIFSSETMGPIEAKFHMEPHWARGTKVCSNGPGNMTKMAAMPIYGKNLKKNILRNQKIDDLEPWYAASSAQVLPNLFKWWPWVQPYLLYGKVKFGPVCFCMGKGKTMDISETILVYDVKVIHWPWSKVTHSQHFQTSFS